MTVRVLTAAGTFEQRLDEILRSKKDLAKDFDKSSASWLSYMTDAEMKKIFMYCAPEQRAQPNPPDEPMPDAAPGGPAGADAGAAVDPAEPERPCDPDTVAAEPPAKRARVDAGSSTSPARAGA